MYNCLQLPEARLIEYDCGKLQTLGRLLSELRKGAHRVLIFTQMTKMLDVLEAFLNSYGIIYLRWVNSDDSFDSLTLQISIRIGALLNLS